MTTPPHNDPAASRRAFLKRCGIAAGVTGAAGLGAGVWLWNRRDKDDGAQPFRDLIEFVEAEIKRKTVPGAGLMITRNGETVLDRSFGTYCGFEQRGVPLDSSVLTLLYSVSKTITSTVIVMAKQDGLVEYDAPISRYVPEFKGGERDAVTLRHCLALASGIPSIPLGSMETEEKWQAALKRVCQLEPRWKPGSRSEFHNIVGHFLAAECARRRSGMKAWNDICRERLFGPLGTASLTFEYPPAARLALSPQPAALPAQGPAFDDFSPGHPAGGCIGTLGDVLKVMNLHLQGGTWGGKTLIDPAAFKEMHTVQYAREIAEAQKAGVAPAHKSWGLGILVRGDGPDDPGYQDYGFDGRTTPTMFGQNGITTLVTAADPTLGVAFVFATTDSPKPEGKTVELWNGVSKRAFDAAKG